MPPNVYIHISAVVYPSLTDSLHTSLSTSHQISLGQDDRQSILLYWCRLVVLAQHYVVLYDVSEINVSKL